MWHEARKQEKFIRTVMVDVKKRAERRKVFYEKIKLDPIRFLRLYGTKLKVSMEPEVAMAAENPGTMMVWAGDNETVIDRFDARTNLDSINSEREKNFDSDERLHERMCNYERFRCLVHNQFAKVSETIALSQIDMAEKYGEDIHKVETKDSKKKTSDKAAIGYVYADTDYTHAGSNSDNDSDSQDSEPDLEMDLDIELDISRLSIPQQKDLLKLSHQFGMHGNDYLKLMKLDKNNEEDLKTAKLLEEQKAQFHGRKSRRERKIFKEQKLKERYLRQDPRTLSYGASSFREELYEGKRLLTPSPNRDSKSQSASPDSKKLGNNSSKSLKDFVTVPTLRIASRGRSRSRSRSRDYRRSPSSPMYGPRLPASRKRSSYRDNSDGRDRRRSHNDRYSRSPERNSRTNRDSGTRAEPDRISSHNYRLSKSRSPPLAEEEILKKKYYHSDPEEEKSSDSDSSNSSVEQLRIKTKSKYNESHSKKFSEGQSNHSKMDGGSRFNPKDLLKKQMEIQLNRAYRADKKAEQEKQQKIEKERLDRENQLKEMAAQIRKRELERRRKERQMSRSRSGECSSGSSSSSDGLRSRSRGHSVDRSHPRDGEADRSMASGGERTRHCYR